MQLAIELLNTLETLENKGMHKFADRLANTMIKLASIDEILTLNNALKLDPKKSKFVKPLIDWFLINDPNFINSLLSKSIENGKLTANFPYILKAINDSGVDLSTDLNRYLLSNNFLTGTLDDKLKYLEQFAASNPSLRSQLKPVITDLMKDPEFNVLKLGKYKNLDAAAELLKLTENTKLTGDIGKEVVELGTKGKAVRKVLEDDAVTRKALEKAAQEIPVLRGAIPTILKWIGIVGMVPSVMGLVGDINKYGMDKIMDDTELSMKFGQNIIGIITGVAQMFPIFGWMLAPIDIALNLWFEKRRADVLEEQKSKMDPMLDKARKHVEYLVATDPETKLHKIVDDVRKFYSYATTHSLANQERFEKFINEEIPQLVKQIRDKNKNATSTPTMPTPPQGTAMTGNFNKETGKWEYKPMMANNKANRTVVADTLKAARELEKEGNYMEADIANRIALELTKMTR